MQKKNLHNLRFNYVKGALIERSLPLNPFVLFDSWFSQAVTSSEKEPNAMILSTVSQNNFPSSRAVLLKQFSNRGFEFFTNYNSRKAMDIDVNSNVALLFLWLLQERQVRIEGLAQKISRRESLAYFKTRPRESCISAWASEQSAVIENKNTLLERKSYFENKFKGKEIPCPSWWGGYLIKPSIFEFWQGGDARLHDRILYKKVENNWIMQRLAP